MNFFSILILKYSFFPLFSIHYKKIVIKFVTFIIKVMLCSETLAVFVRVDIKFH